MFRNFTYGFLLSCSLISPKSAAAMLNDAGGLDFKPSSTAIKSYKRPKSATAKLNDAGGIDFKPNFTAKKKSRKRSESDPSPEELSDKSQGMITGEVLPDPSSSHPFLSIPFMESFLDILPIDDLKQMSLVSKNCRQQVHAFLKQDIDSLVNYYRMPGEGIMTEYGAEYEGQDSPFSKDEEFRLARLKQMKASFLLDRALRGEIIGDSKAKFAEDRFTIVPKSSPLARYIPDAEICHNYLLSQALSKDSYEALRNEVGDHISLASLQHALSRYKIFAETLDGLDQQILFERAKTILEKSGMLSSYVSLKQLMDGEYDINTNYLSLSLEEFNTSDNQDIVKTFFDANPEATLVIDVNYSFLRDEDLKLPDFVKRLAVMNSQGNLTNICSFVLQYTNLTHFDGSGLTAVKKIRGDTIGAHFLSGCKSLTHFDGSGFIALEEIGGGFLAYCTSLVHFDSSGFSAVKQIGNTFLYNCTSLTHFESSGFIALEEISDSFLARCTSLVHFYGSGFTAVKKIGRYFLGGCKSLGYFNGSGFASVENVGDGFGKGTLYEGLEYFYVLNWCFC